MPYKILPTKEFEKDFNKIDSFMKERIKKKINEVAENPGRYKHLHYGLAGSCRLWMGKLRIIFSYSIEKQELYPEKIVFGHKYWIKIVLFGIEKGAEMKKLEDKEIIEDKEMFNQIVESEKNIKKGKIKEFDNLK